MSTVKNAARGASSSGGISLLIYRSAGEEPVSRSFGQSKITIGRNAHCTLMLPDKGVSFEHAVLYKEAKGFFVEDMQSTNGTFLNGKPIPSGTKVGIPEGASIAIGPYSLQIGSEPKEQRRSPKAIKHSENITAPIARVDPALVALKSDVRRRLIDEMNLRRFDSHKADDRQLRQRCRDLVHSILHQMKFSDIRESLVKEILDEALGLGPLEDMLNDPAISEIMVIRPDCIYIEKNGRIEPSSLFFSSLDAVRLVVDRIVAPLGKRIDESSPMVDARLKDGSRVHIVIPPLALNGPCITIRKFAKNVMGIDALLNQNTLSPSMAGFIRTSVVYRKNLIISGGTGSGKTTTLNVISGFIPHDERIVTIEDAAELQLCQDHVVRLESKPANIEGRGAISIRELVRNALRMRPDRIIVGECRGKEALDMLQAMNTGHDGSMTTGHANSPVDMVSRLETMALSSDENLPIMAVRQQIASALDIIIQQKRFPCGSRKITQISEVIGMDDGDVILQDIFYFRQTGLDENGRVQGNFLATGWIPDFYEDLFSRGADVDMSIFH